MQCIIYMEVCLDGSFNELLLVLLLVSTDLCAMPLSYGTHGPRHMCTAPSRVTSPRDIIFWSRPRTSATVQFFSKVHFFPKGGPFATFQFLAKVHFFSQGGIRDPLLHSSFWQESIFFQGGPFATF